MNRHNNNVPSKRNNSSKSVHNVMLRHNSKGRNNSNKDKSKEELKLHHSNKEVALKEEGHQEVAEDRLISPDFHRDFFIF
jgi:hypothetical protein